MFFHFLAQLDHGLDDFNGVIEFMTNELNVKKFLKHLIIITQMKSDNTSNLDYMGN